MNKFLPFLFILHLFLFSMCSKKNSNELFELVPSDQSGINFSNDISENDSVNILKMEYIYNGGGVAVGDFNNDGLSDIFFSGNQVPCRLYLNKGNMKFEDVSIQSQIKTDGKWNSGVALADINGDGFLDIYLCATIKNDSLLRENMLFVNQGLNKDGVPTFSDEAKKYGLADNGHSQGAAFLDYDNDGDLDLYVLTNTLKKEIPLVYHEKILTGRSPTTDRLYKNNGNGTFTNVSRDAGILIEGYGLGIAIADFNNDNWPDIYVSNDYITNDILYINNQNGTFSNKIEKFVKHQSQFSMGNDVSDINNDGFPEIITADMLPENNLRRKTVINPGNYSSYINNEKFGYEFQHVRNMLQLNNGDNTFSEIGQFSGVFQTEWSWSPLFADFDNDGFRDLIITNGFPKDITDKDFGNYRSGPAGAISNVEMMIDSIPVVKVPNYAFKNNGDLTFSDVTKQWGMNIPSFSNGAAYADLDNDGDLDYVVNNINDKAFLFENKLYNQGGSEKAKSNYLRIKLIGPKENLIGLGTKISIHYAGGKTQYSEHSIYRGYLSTVDNILHFGLGESNVVDSIMIKWPDGNSQQIKNITANQVISLKYTDANQFNRVAISKAMPTYLKEVSSNVNVLYKHDDEDIIDFYVQRTLPHKYSQSGPGLAVGDINGDELDDFYASGASNRPGAMFVQKENGTFTSQEIKPVVPNEELGVLFFDADNDGDLDLYAVGGSYEWIVGNKNYRDRFYRNDGAGRFKEDTTALPKIFSSGSCVRAADYDGDGDLDLFVGGRVVPGKYPLPPESFILKNEGGVFSDVTSEICPILKNIGMVTDAIWSDFDNDGRIDIVISGEFLPISFFKNNGKSFSLLNDTGVNRLTGWWNSLIASDFDKDGDIDYVAGNLGQNNYYRVTPDRPVVLFAKDFDKNGSIDPITACYFKMEDGTMKLCPTHSWEELSSLSPKFRKQFTSFSSYGRTTMDMLLSESDKEDAIILSATCSSTSYFENLGNGKFKATALPMEAQLAPIFGMVSEDVNDDGNLDILMIGNDYGNEVFSGRHDAFNGLILLGEGNGQFKSCKKSATGFSVSGDGKSLAKLYDSKGNELFIATQNKDSLKVFSKIIPKTSVNNKLISLQQLDTWGIVTYSNDKKEKIEFYFGSGYLSQSTRKISIPKDVKEVVIYDSKGKSRKILPNGI